MEYLENDKIKKEQVARIIHDNARTSLTILCYLKLIIKKMPRYEKPLYPMYESLLQSLVIETFKVIDNSKKAKERNLNFLLKNNKEYKKKFSKYSDLIEDIVSLRNKYFAHNTEEKSFDFLVEKNIKDIDKFLRDVVDFCEEINPDLESVCKVTKYVKGNYLCFEY